jgi:DNA-binding transcriptional regulator YiaG
MSRKGTVSEPDTNIQNPAKSVNHWTPERVSALRASLDLSQEEFGKRVGRSRQQVSGWETGDVAVTRRVAAQLEALAATGATPAVADAPTATLMGLAIEVEALLASALERQRQLVAAMGGPYRDRIVERVTQQLQARPVRPPQSKGE